jgi:hypothetical protein
VSVLFERNPADFKKGFGVDVGCALWVIKGQEDVLNLPGKEVSFWSVEQLTVGK